MDEKKEKKSSKHDEKVLVPPPPPDVAAPSAPVVLDIKAALERVLKSCPKDLHNFLGTASAEQVKEYHDARDAAVISLRAHALKK